MSKYENMSIEELEAAINKISGQRNELKTQQLEIHAVLEKKLQKAEAERKAANLSDGEKEALLQVLQADGIGSGEVIGEF